MSYLDRRIIICPYCEYRAIGIEFSPSCADECFCPKCDERFEIEHEDDGE